MPLTSRRPSSLMRVPAALRVSLELRPHRRSWIVLLALSVPLCALASPMAAAERAPFFIDPRAIAIVERFERVVADTETFTYEDLKVERLRDGDVITERLAVKFQKPGRAYLRMISPHPGQEVIYDPTRDPKELIVHPGRFPDLTLSLDIEGMLATRNQHHTVAVVGFAESARILRTGIERAKADPHGERLEYGGERELSGRKVELVRMITGTRPASKVRAQRRERLFDFARRVGMDAYAIYMANPQIRSLTSRLDAGEDIVVPAYYVHRSESWFDRETGLPLRQEMWTADGKLYERYEKHNLVVGPALTELDFDPENPDYGF